MSHTRMRETDLGPYHKDVVNVVGVCFGKHTRTSHITRINVSHHTCEICTPHTHMRKTDPGPHHKDVVHVGVDNQIEVHA